MTFALSLNSSLRTKCGFASLFADDKKEKRIAFNPLLRRHDWLNGAIRRVSPAVPKSRDKSNTRDRCRTINRKSCEGGRERGGRRWTSMHYKIFSRKRERGRKNSLAKRRRNVQNPLITNFYCIHRSLCGSSCSSPRTDSASVLNYYYYRYRLPLLLPVDVIIVTNILHYDINGKNNLYR